MPYSNNANYTHDRQKSPELFARSTFKMVPLSHTKYNGTKYDRYNCLAIVGKLRKNGKWSIQSILVPKKINKNAIEKETGMKVIGIKNYPNDTFLYLKNEKPLEPEQLPILSYEILDRIRLNRKYNGPVTLKSLALDLDCEQNEIRDSVSYLRNNKLLVGGFVVTPKGKKTYFKFKKKYHD